MAGSPRKVPEHFQGCGFELIICTRFIIIDMFYMLKNYQPYIEKLGPVSINQTELSAGTIKTLLFPIPAYQGRRGL